MTFRGISDVLIALTQDGEDRPKASVEYGLALAKQATAHVSLTVPTLKLVLTHASMSRIGEQLEAEENSRLHALAHKLADQARDLAAAAQIDYDIHCQQLVHSDLQEAFVRQARLHDLTILDAEESTMDVDFSLMEAALFDVGRPVIVVPRDHREFRCRKVVLAWDGSLRAVRAVADALTLLQAANEVHVLCVEGEKDLSQGASGAGLVKHLSRHGIRAILNEIKCENGDVAETLRARCAATGANMIVMGAYGHSRLRQWILGGVTSSLLRSSPVPLFLSH
jgi:nucleotide-binding universal stress UspA family protein